MTTPSYTVACLKNERIARDIYEFRLEKPEALSFEPGQFVLFDVPLKGSPEDIQTRAFSIASSPDEAELVFVAKLKAGGRASVWIEEMLRPGSPVRLQGPFGRFVLHPEKPGDLLFICTSTGVAPFRAQVVHALTAGDGRRMDLIFGVREEHDLFWVEEFSALARAHANFFLHIALSQPMDAWSGHRGRVQTLVPLIAGNLPERMVYICGNPAMTTELKNLCLNEWGVCKENLHVEGYI